MSITIKAIDILKAGNKYQVREIHDGGKKGQVYKNHGNALYSEAEALRRARRHKVNLPVNVLFLGIMEGVL